MRRYIAFILIGIALAVSFALLTPTTTWAVDEPCDYPLSGNWPESGSWTCETDPPPEPARPKPMPPDKLKGNLCVAFGGVSLHDKGEQDEGIITLEDYHPTESSTIKRAYILWSGRTESEQPGDSNIEILVGNEPRTIDADLSTQAFSTKIDSTNPFYWHAYRANITAEYADYQARGLGATVTVSGMTIGTEVAGDKNDNHGVGIIVIYEDATHCPYQDIAFFSGNDVLYKKWAPPSGPNSEVACVTVPSLSRATRFDFQMFIGGIADKTRTDSIWFASGYGPQPTQIAPSNAPPQTPPPQITAIDELQDQLVPLGGDEFDSYESSINCKDHETDQSCIPKKRAISAESTWLCLQIESPPDRGRGISAAWLSLVIRTARAGISIEAPQPERNVGESHTWTVTVESTLGLTATTGITEGLPLTPSIIITPNIDPPPTEMTDSCAEPTVGSDGATAMCTVTITSTVAAVYTATARARVNQVVGSETFTSSVTTDGTTGNSGPSIVTYRQVDEPLADITFNMAVNGESASKRPGPLVSIPTPQGAIVTLSYTVANTGEVELEGLRVTDGGGEDVCRDQAALPPSTLSAGESFTCLQMEAAKLGEQQRFGIANAEVQGDPDRTVDAQAEAYYAGVKEDWGDAPDTGPGTGTGNYATTKQDNGPYHQVVDGLILGALVDSEDDGLPSPKALGDDTTYLSDEDGLVGESCLLHGQSASVTVRATNNLTETDAQLYGWFDFNRDGLFATDERASIDLAAGAGRGDYALEFMRTPANDADDIFLRLRLSSDSAAAESTGMATDGEVEDYRLALVMPTLDARADNSSPFVGETVIINGIASTSCGPLDQLRICFDVAGDGTAVTCADTQDGGKASFQYSRDVAREDNVQVWVDLNRDEDQDPGEPLQIVPVHWSIPGGFTVELTPANVTRPVGDTHLVTATLTHADPLLVDGRMLTFKVEGVHPLAEETVETDPAGHAHLSIYGRREGTDTITVQLSGAPEVYSSATVTWAGSYTVTLDPAEQQRIVGTNTELLMIRIAGKEESPIDNLRLFYEVSGLNQIDRLPVGGTTNENGELSLSPYAYSTDANHRGQDKITVGITDAMSAGFDYTNTASVDWVPITMTIVPAAGAEESENIEVRIGVSNTQPPLSGEISLLIKQEDLASSESVTETTYTVTVRTGEMSVTDRPIDQIRKPVRKIDNLIYPGCNIAFFDQSEWKLSAWVDLNRDRDSSGEEPTCIVEEPTSDGVSGLAAQTEARGVRLAWRTASEFNTLGFNLLRSTGEDEPVVVNATPISAEGSVTGVAYEYFDNPSAPGIYQYQLETLFLNGATARSAIVTVRYPEDFLSPNQLFLPAVLGH